MVIHSVSLVFMSLSSWMVISMCPALRSFKATFTDMKGKHKCVVKAGQTIEGIVLG